MYKDRCPLLQYPAEDFHCPKNPLLSTCCLSISPSPAASENHWSFTVSIVLPFPKCHLVGIRQHAAFSDWLLLTLTAAKSLQSCPTLCDPIDGSPPGSGPWDSPGKNTGVGCHFLLQCMKVKSESEVTQSCPTLSDPMNCNLPGSSIHGISQARVLEWGAIAFSLTLTNMYLMRVSQMAQW